MKIPHYFIATTVQTLPLLLRKFAYVNIDPYEVYCLDNWNGARINRIASKTDLIDEISSLEKLVGKYSLTINNFFCDGLIDTLNDMTKSQN